MLASRSSAEHEEETEATAVAERIAPGGSPKANANASAGPGNEPALPAAERARLAATLGPGVEAVRVRRDATAHAMASSHGALAMARGNDVSVSRRAPPASSLAGRWLLAHEITHALQQQQDGDGPRVRKQPPPAPVQPDAVTGVPADLVNPTAGVDVDQAVRVSAPLLAGQRAQGDDADQTYHLGARATGPMLSITVYAVPRARVTVDRAGTQPLETAGAAPPPPVRPGSTVFGPDGASLPVLGSDAANVFVEGTAGVHYAVGAGSCVLVETGRGFYLFDAGINVTEPGSLADAVVAKIVATVGTEGLRAVFLTHAHYDHTSLLARLARATKIDAIVANPLQFSRADFAGTDARPGVRATVHEADDARRAEARAQMEADPVARAEFVRTLERTDANAATYAEVVDRMWHEEVARRVAVRFPPIRELAAIPSGRTGEFDTIDTRTTPEAEAPSQDLADVLPSAEEGVDFRGAVDPAVRRRRTMRPGEVDRFSTTYIMTVDGRRLLILPDIRRTDIVRIRTQMERLVGQTHVSFQEWVAGHHMQAGWSQVSGARAVSAGALSDMLEMLDGLRARGARGATGRDVFIASVDAEQVSAAQMRLLRAIGFETYLAQSGSDVHTYDVLSRGQVVRAVRGAPAAEARGEPTVRRSIAARADLLARLTDAQERMASMAPAERGPLRAEVRQLAEQRTHIQSLENQVIDALRREPFDQAAADAAEHGLNTALDDLHFARVATSSSQLTDTAMVLIRQELGDAPAAGTPEAAVRERALALRQRKSRVDALRDQVNDASATPEARQAAAVELYTELVHYQQQLETARDAHDPGVSRDFTQAEIDRITRDRSSLEVAQQAGEPARMPDGTLVENRVVRVQAPEPGSAAEPRAPSALSRGLLQGLEATGRVMGAFMVYSTVRGAVDMVSRYEAGEINTAQLAIGGVHEAANAVVSVRMVTGLHVSSGVFVVLSLLEVGEAVAGDYDSGAQRRRAEGAAVRNAAVNIGCMYAGEALIATANPIGIIAGAAVMFLGPLLINLLFNDQPEELFPTEVGAVDETLQRLLDEYRDVVGAILALQRSPEERGDIGLTEDIGSVATRSIQHHRTQALFLEARILDQFDAAYDAASRGRAGLHELDQMRQQFLTMRQQASTDAADAEIRAEINRGHDTALDAGVGGGDESGMGAGAGSHASYMPDDLPGEFSLPVEHDASGRELSVREQTIARFRRMEERLSSLGTMTADEVHDMPQWTSIRDYATELLNQDFDDPDWADVAQRQHDLEARVASARYRIHPTGTTRVAPLVPEGSPARQAYDEELAAAEQQLAGVELFLLQVHLENFRQEGVDVGAIQVLDTPDQPGGPLDSLLVALGGSIDLYERTAAEIDGPPPAVGGAAALYADPAARATYMQELANNGTFRKQMHRMQVTDVATRALLDRGETIMAFFATASPTAASPAAAGTTTPTARLAALRDRFRIAENDRKIVRGLLFAEEIDQLGATRRTEAMTYFTAHLAHREGERALSPEERAAFESGDYGPIGERILSQPHSLQDRLAMVTDLRPPSGPTSVTDAGGETMRVSRSVTGIMRLDGLTTDTRQLVGLVGRPTFYDWQYVVPLTDSAVRALGGYAPVMVDSNRLTPVTEQELQ